MISVFEGDNPWRMSFFSCCFSYGFEYIFMCLLSPGYVHTQFHLHVYGKIPFLLVVHSWTTFRQIYYQLLILQAEIYRVWKINGRMEEQNVLIICCCKTKNYFFSSNWFFFSPRRYSKWWMVDAFAVAKWYRISKWMFCWFSITLIPDNTDFLLNLIPVCWLLESGDARRWKKISAFLSALTKNIFFFCLLCPFTYWM